MCLAEMRQRFPWTNSREKQWEHHLANRHYFYLLKIKMKCYYCIYLASMEIYYGHNKSGVWHSDMNSSCQICVAFLFISFLYDTIK